MPEASPSIPFCQAPKKPRARGHHWQSAETKAGMEKEKPGEVEQHLARQDSGTSQVAQEATYRDLPKRDGNTQGLARSSAIWQGLNHCQLPLSGNAAAHTPQHSW